MKVDKNIPVPLFEFGLGRMTKWPFANMSLGDSAFFTPEQGCEKARSAAYVIGYSKAWKFISRKENGGIRIWRVK